MYLWRDVGAVDVSAGLGLDIVGGAYDVACAASAGGDLWREGISPKILRSKGMVR